MAGFRRRLSNEGAQTLAAVDEFHPGVTALPPDEAAAAADRDIARDFEQEVLGEIDIRIERDHCAAIRNVLEHARNGAVLMPKKSFGDDGSADACPAIRMIRNTFGILYASHLALIGNGSAVMIKLNPCLPFFDI
jgi:hypothetical protein